MEKTRKWKREKSLSEIIFHSQFLLVKEYGVWLNCLKSWE